MAHLKQIVGLDIGTRNVRAAWVQLRGGAPVVTRLAEMALPLEGGDREKLLHSWLGKQGLLRSFAAVPLAGTQLVFQPGRIAPNDPRTARQVTEVELATFNDMAGDQMVADVVEHEWRPGTRAYLMAMARPGVINEALQQLEPLTIRPAELVPAPLALYNALMPLASQSTPGCSLLLNIGHNRTELVIGSAKGVLFARSFAMGGRPFTEALAKAAGVTITQAETQKHREGTIETGGAHAEVLRPLAERWYSQLAAALSAYRSGFSGHEYELQQIIVAGGGGELRGFTAYIAERSGLSVVKADELPGGAKMFAAARQASESAGGVAGARRAGRYDLALGVAVVALGCATAPLSLLPEKLRGEVVFREKKPFLIAASIMGALTLGVMTASMVVATRAETENLDEERAELRRREAMDKSINTIRQRDEVLRQRGGPLRKLLLGGPLMREVISLVANSIAPEDWISMICEESSYSAPAREAPATVREMRPRAGIFVPGFRTSAGTGTPAVRSESEKAQLAAPTPPPPSSSFEVFIIEGYTPDMGLVSVKKMIQRLETARLVRKVDLLSDDRVLPPTLPEELREQGVELPNMRRFVVRLEVRQP